ncbi:probable UDP-arabinopyranose mutase 5 [Cryptomeria japonica]|uniref:probable UDP-arabinopyranose mutase 5 n=1 Tax=Cryptomeria japonica TaxID=3369 RepID=UPI0027DA3B78|nr:probable UDP-arabinopyranose mutase 5 [Cryptomeria japonica]XP_057819863.2 probable UDP-arabinopyranose mutase 5 [Cryptomeria japonica]
MAMEINANEVDIVVSVTRPDPSFLEAWMPFFSPYHVIVVQEPELEENVKVPSGLNHTLYTKHDMERILGIGVLNSLGFRGHSCRAFGYLMSKKKYIFSLDDDCIPAKDPNGYLINPLEQHIVNLMNPSTPFFFNTLYDPYRDGSDFVRGYPFSLRQGVPCAISCGLWMNLPDYDAPTQILKPDERNTRYVDAVLTVPHGALFPMSGINIAFNREIIGPAMFSGLARSGAGKPLLSRYDTLEDIWCGLCCKVICDHLGYGIKTGLPYVWRKEDFGDPMVSLSREYEGVKWLEEIVPFFQALRLPRTALTVEDCFAEIGKQVKDKFRNLDPLFSEVGTSMEDWAKAWKAASS